MCVCVCMCFVNCGVHIACSFLAQMHQCDNSHARACVSLMYCLTQVRAAPPSNFNNSSRLSPPAQAPPPHAARPTRERYQPPQQPPRSWRASSESTNSVGFTDSEDDASINPPYEHTERGGQHAEEKTRVGISGSRFLCACRWVSVDMPIVYFGLVWLCWVSVDHLMV